MYRRMIVVALFALAVWLGAILSAEAGRTGYGVAAHNTMMNSGSGYNHYTGGYYHGGAVHNPYTGRTTAGRSYYNPYTNTYGHAAATYNPYTGRTGYSAQRYSP
jgi:hypothetical protein